MNSERRSGGGDRRSGGIYMENQIHDVSLLLGEIKGTLGALQNTVDQQHIKIDRIDNILTNYRLKVAGISTVLSLITALIVSAVA